ncbi:VOC family protein [Actinopolymorpha sp. B11F2]|uniref:VOC family protein n=1 Tax=Actinopolymorpha sp. B11F2 TaxID=3160862 RepID=UPI0032E4A2DF
MSESTPASPNPLAWWEIQVPDLDVAQAFYGAVFGWTFEPFEDGFVVAKTADGTMVGGLDTSAGDAPPAGRRVHVYFRSDDLEATLRAVQAAGGAVVQPRTLISEGYGWFATAADPSGLQFGLVTDKPATPAG